jgi:zinc transporter ZupT
VSKSLFLSVARRAVPAGLVVAAAFADASGSPRLAFYALLALVPVAAAVALGAYGDLVEEALSPEDAAPRLQVGCWGLLVALAVLGAAARAPSLPQGLVPKLATSALIACIVVLCVEGVVELVVLLRRERGLALEEEGSRVARQVN